MGGPIVSSSLLFVRGKNRVGQAAFLCGRYRDSRWQRERKEETQKAILLPFPIEFCFFFFFPVDFPFFSRFFCFFFLLTAASLIVAYNLFSPLIRKERRKTNLDCFFFVFQWKGVILIECLHTLVFVQILQSHYLALHSPCRRHS